MEQPVRINKIIALLLVIVNIIYIVIALGRAVLMHGQYLSAPSNNWTSVHSVQFQLGLAFFGYIIMFGILWVLITFKESAFVKSGIIVELISAIAMVFFTMAITTMAAKFYWTITSISMVFGIVHAVILIYTVITYFCVQHKAIKSRFIIYAVALLMVNVFMSTVGYLSNLNITWPVRYIDFVGSIPLLFSLMIFIHVYNLARKQDNDQYLQSKSALPFNFNKEN